jgi:hypothetical protein
VAKAERPLSVQSADLRGDVGNGRDAPQAAVRAAHRLSFASSALGACRARILLVSRARVRLKESRSSPHQLTDPLPAGGFSVQDS